MSYSVVVTYQTPSGNKTVGTNSSKQNSTISNLQSQGYKIIKIEAQGAGKNVVAPVKAAVPSAQQNKETTTIYEAGTPIGKELEAPVAPIKTEPLPMNTLTSTRTSSGEQYVRTEYTQTPEGILKTTTTTFNPSKLDSSVKAIPEVKQQPSIIDQIISAPGNFISSLKIGYETLQNPEVQKIITEKNKENTSRGLAAIFNPEQFQLAYNVYSGTGDSPDVIYERNYQAYKTLIEKKDIGGIGLRVAGSPLVVVGSSYLLGAGLGGFAATKIGQMAAFTIKGLRVTPALTLNTGVGTIFGAGMVKSGYEAATSGNIKSFLGTTALSLPLFVVPFKAGYKAGGGYVQRTGAMGTITEPTQRVQQKAVYDMMKQTERLHEPYLDQKPYNISQVKEPPNLTNLEQFMKSLISVMIRKPAIGGSTAMDIQMGEFFRKGGYPEKVLEIARERQSQTMQPEMRNVPLKLSGSPGDIDILLGGKLATTKMADVWSKELNTHVHVSKPGIEYWGGYSTKSFTNSLVSFTDEPISVKTLSVREQFLRYGHSVLPSNIMEKSYRAYKDVPGFFDTYDVLQFQKGGTKLNEAMDRFLYPEGYKASRVTIGEKLIKGIGGTTKLSEDWSYGSSKLGYVPSYRVSSIISNPIYSTNGYIKPVSIYISPINKGYDYQSSYPQLDIYNPPTPIYTPIKLFNTPPYNPPKYNPPPYNPPIYKPPYYNLQYNPPTKTPKINLYSDTMSRKKEEQMQFLLYGGHYRERRKKTKGFIQSLGFDVMKQQRDLFKRFGM